MRNKRRNSRDERIWKRNMGHGLEVKKESDPLTRDCEL
jgi:hypothetical protein